MAGAKTALGHAARTSRLRHLRRRGSGSCLEFDASQSIPAFLPARRRQALALARTGLRRAGIGEIHLSGHLLSAHPPSFELPTWLSDLDRQIAILASAPLTPNVVKQVLGITGQARARWAKDGRLAQTSPGALRAGAQRVSFSRHPVAAIAILVDAPETIEAWRKKDAGAPIVRPPSRNEPTFP